MFGGHWLQLAKGWLHVHPWTSLQFRLANDEDEFHPISIRYPFLSPFWFFVVSTRKGRILSTHLCLDFCSDAFRISWTLLLTDESKRPILAACTDRVSSAHKREPKDRKNRAIFATPAYRTWPIQLIIWLTLTTTTTSRGGNQTRCWRASSTQLKSTWRSIYVSYF